MVFRAGVIHSVQPLCLFDQIKNQDYDVNDYDCTFRTNIVFFNISDAVEYSRIAGFGTNEWPLAHGSAISFLIIGF